jgi:hypothetical protein
MKTSQIIGVVLMIAVFLPLGAAQSEPQQQAVLQVGSAMVSEVKGEVVFTSPQGTPISAQRGVTLTAESRIETAKGSVLLELQDGSQVWVKAKSNIVLKAPNEGEGFSLELFIGKIMAKVQKRLSGAPSFRMGTPSAVITVRGTLFSVEVNKKHKTYVDVFEGLVDVAGVLKGSPHVLIRPGFSTGVEIERNPEGPREMNPSERNGRDDGREGQGPGNRNPEDQQRNQAPPRNPNQNSEGKPD